ncbi:TIGR03862 family flavoprotein [Loktanella sp. M215]|uniref:TIGR03862 family flavoprotein n=1 Tax=Loktanella sp. M215 TaxID=2675431 RepID=UPI001F1A67B1|nr:TIGR03862 family flavoprotein [Loktanella sp. M215]MCF7698789.1 TIGR03862 family flavoprotein [Loktanella sp. M215]
MTAQTPQTALVIGAGPAGLMAAEVLSAAGLQVTVADRMPSVGRKFLMAGKSGLNLTKDEDTAACLAAYGDATEALRDAVAAFGPAEVMAWAERLGQPLFTGSTGRVFPVAMKASPLLRAWLARLATRDVRIVTRWTWTGWDGAAATFDTPDGPQAITTDVTILALGGASWRRLGSDGAWAAQFADTAPFQPANCGFRVAWSDHMTPFFGQPVKATALKAGGLSSRGEWVITRDGIEGGGIYAVSRAVREGAPLHVDLMPDMTATRIGQRVTAKGGKASLSQVLKSGLRLSPVKIALFHEMTRRAGTGAGAPLAGTLKALPLIHDGPAPLDSAISTAGGLRFKALSGFMLRDRPGVFACGEMLDWEAPTGGYLITASLATGRAAALQALAT